MTHEHEHEHEHEHQHLDYPSAVRAFRVEKDEFFRTGHGSPLPATGRADFAGLPYFPIEEGLRFESLMLEPYSGDEPVSFEIPTSDGKLRPAQRAGVLRFDVDAVPCRLTAYTFAGGGSESLFVPFLDGTSGTESYGAGRYLDLEAELDGSYVVDFNLAYHPSCVYDTRFSCPLTPAENRL